MGLLETGEWIVNKKGGAKIYCCTLNEAMKASESEVFKKILLNGTILTADGMPLVWKMKQKMGKGERVYGPDLMRLVLKKTIDLPMRHLMIGSRENIKLGKLKNSNYYIPEYKDKFGKEDINKIVGEIKSSKADVVWISLGAEKQIEVAHSLAEILPDKIYISVGAAFDFLSGNKRQAPKLVQKIGFEWLYRLINEPKRLGKRYLKCVLFLVKYWGRD